jgi:hypothetical protein
LLAREVNHLRLACNLLTGAAHPEDSMTRLLSLLTVVMLAACGADSASSSSEEAAKRKRCSSNADCTELQFCDTEAASSCGAKGVCTARGINLFCVSTVNTVCGCDGNQYGSGCLAHKAGTSVAYEGACRCDSNPSAIDGDTLAELPWTDASQTYFYTFTGNGTVDNTNGTFVMQIEWPCLRTTPHCAILTPAPKTGVFYTWGSTVELDYDSGDVAFFDASADCHNSISLTGDDNTQHLTLTVSPIAP